MSYAPNPLSPLPVYPGTRPRFHAMVKPTGAICNLDCTYCYYLHKEQQLGSNSRFRISDESLETHIRQYIESQRGEEVVFPGRGASPRCWESVSFRKWLRWKRNISVRTNASRTTCKPGLMKFWQHIDGPMQDIMKRVEHSASPANPRTFHV